VAHEDQWDNPDKMDTTGHAELPVVLVERDRLDRLVFLVDKVKEENREVQETRVQLVIPERVEDLAIPEVQEERGQMVYPAEMASLVQKDLQDQTDHLDFPVKMDYQDDRVMMVHAVHRDHQALLEDRESESIVLNIMKNSRLN